MTGLLFGVLAVIGGHLDERVHTGDVNGRGPSSSPDEIGPKFTLSPDIMGYEGPLPYVSPTTTIRTRLAQDDVVLDPRQPRYEEKLIEQYRPQYDELVQTRVKSRREAGIIRFEYKPPPMPIQTGARRGR